MIKQQIFDEIINAIDQAAKSGNLGQLKSGLSENLAVEKTKNPEFGDYAINISSLAKFAKIPPSQIAQVILPYIKMKDVEINAINGFINFKLGYSWLNNNLKSIIEKKNEFGRNDSGNSEKVLLEYVSANPTGPLHIGHGRWAAVGSALANLMDFSGYKVLQEFYINDIGNQINSLGKSFWLRVLQTLEYDVKFPETEEEGSKNYYPGKYLLDIAQNYLKENKEKALKFYENNPDPYNPSVIIIKEMSDYAKALLLQEQKDLLYRFKVDFDFWYSESTLHERGKVKEAIEKLKIQDEIYEKDGAVWFKSSKYGDDQDRVIIKSDGAYTYLTADIAYHYDKLKRGFDKLINIWGADHHGYVPRIKASIEALGYDNDCLEVLLGQLVNLIVDGEQVRMGKRKKMLTMEELVNEVGIDATRFWMIMRSIDTTLDFDVELAKSCSDENPVYYVQYAHARASSILRTALAERFDQDKKNILPPLMSRENLDNIINSEKFDIILLDALWHTKDEKELESTRNLAVKLESFKDTVLVALKLRAPNVIARYIQELAGDFHYFYTFSRVLNVEESVMKARLSLVYATKQVLYNALSLLGVSAPESM
ncbi:MAG: arginine--tRNA ligase [bacterium]